MIAKHLKGRDFYGCLKYVLSKPDAVILDGIVNGSSVESLARQFQIYTDANPRVKQVVYHAILSTTADEPLNDELWLKLAQDYLQMMEYTQVPYLVVRHHDTKHHHVHIVAGRVRADGSCVSSRWDKIRSMKATRLIEQKYHLKPLLSNYRSLEYQPLDDEQAAYTYIQAVIGRLFQKEQSMVEFLRSLQKHQITVSLRKKRQIFYEYQGKGFIGTQLGIDYTWDGLILRGLSSKKVESKKLDEFRPKLNTPVQKERLNLIAPIVKELFERFAQGIHKDSTNRLTIEAVDTPNNAVSFCSTSFQGQVLQGQFYTITKWKNQYRLLRNEDRSTIYQATLYNDHRWDILSPSKITELDLQRFQAIKRQLSEKTHERIRNLQPAYSSKSL